LRLRFNSVLLVMRKPDDVLGLSDQASATLCDDPCRLSLHRRTRFFWVHLDILNRRQLPPFGNRLGADVEILV
jgi:hypothetical protein